MMALPCLSSAAASPSPSRNSSSAPKRRMAAISSCGARKGRGQIGVTRQARFFQACTAPQGGDRRGSAGQRAGLAQEPARAAAALPGPTKSDRLPGWQLWQIDGVIRSGGPAGACSPCILPPALPHLAEHLLGLLLSAAGAQHGASGRVHALQAGRLKGCGGVGGGLEIGAGEVGLEFRFEVEQRQN